MKYFELTKEEDKLLDDIEAGKFVVVKDLDKAKKNATAAAVNTLQKAKNINIRLSQKDLQKLKTKAAKEGLPYQTLASSIIHRSVVD